MSLHFFKFWHEMEFQIFDKNENTGVYRISQLIFSRAGKLLREEAKFCRKVWLNFVTILRDFSATLVCMLYKCTVVHTLVWVHA